MNNYNRREFMVTASLLALAPALNGIRMSTSQVVHHVFFWLKNPDSDIDRQQLIEGLQTLASIPPIKKLLIGTPAPTEQRDVVDSSYDVSELMFFDSASDQQTYQDHPVHKAFVDKYSHLWQKVIVYDMLTV